MLKAANNWFNRQNTVVQITIMLLFVFIVRTMFFGLYQVPTGSMEKTMLVGERFFADKFTPIFGKLKRGDIISFNDPTYNYSNNTLHNIWQRYVWGPSNWTKRIIGLPDERVTGIIENGKPEVYINGAKLNEPYINEYQLIAIWTQKPSITNQKFWKNGLPYAYRSYDPKKGLEEQPFYKLEPWMIIDHPAITQIKNPGTPSERGTDVFDIKLGQNEYWVMGDNRRGSSDSRFWGPLDGKLIHGKIKFRIFSIDSSRGWWILDLLLHPISFWPKVRWSRCLNVVR